MQPIQEFNNPCERFMSILLEISSYLQHLCLMRLSLGIPFFKGSKGSFNNYVDQILPCFDYHPLEGTKIEILLTIYSLSCDPRARGLPTNLPPPSPCT